MTKAELIEISFGKDKILDLEFLRGFVEYFKSVDGKTPVVILGHEYIKPSADIEAQHIIYIVPELSSND